MKKIASFLFTVLLALSLSACDDVADWLLDDDDSTNSGAEEIADDSDLLTDDLRSAIVDLAREQIGLPYLYGGEDPSTGFDCSGLCYYCYTSNGIEIPRVSRDQYAGGNQVGMEGAKYGDIVAFYSPVSHVGIITSSTTFIHAPSSGSVVKEQEFIGYWENQITGVVSYIDE